MDSSRPALPPCEHGQNARTYTGWDATRYTVRHAADDMKKPRGKGLILRIARSRRYQLDLPNAKTARAGSMLHEQVFAPVLSSVAHYDPWTARETQHDIDHHYESIRRALYETMQAVGIAA